MTKRMLKLHRGTTTPGTNSTFPMMDWLDKDSSATVRFGLGTHHRLGGGSSKFGILRIGMTTAFNLRVARHYKIKIKMCFTLSLPLSSFIVRPNSSFLAVQWYGIHTLNRSLL